MENSLVRITAYLTDMSRYPEYNEVRTKFMGTRPPASTTVQITSLAFDGLVVEMDAVA
ncbi:MAG: RidA family protein [Acidobacteriota bacterium]